MMKLRQFAFVAGCAAAVASAPAWADVKWKFDFPSANCTNTSCYGNTKNASSVTGTFSDGTSPGGVGSITASAWSNTVGSANSQIESAYLASWGSNGLGVQNRDGVTMPGSPSGGGTSDGVEGGTPEHAMDNNERYEAILFSFTDLIRLTGVEIGWPSSGGSYDSDIFVMAYTGGAATPPLAGSSFASLTSSSWQLVGNYADLPANVKTSVNTGGQTGGTIYSSKHWLIGSRIPGLGTTCQDTGSGGKNNGCDTYTDDYAKLLAVYGDRTRQVPEPGALLLVGVALAGLWVTRRRALA
jgi:hypothetical protein